MWINTKLVWWSLRKSYLQIYNVRMLRIISRRCGHVIYIYIYDTDRCKSNLNIFNVREPNFKEIPFSQLVKLLNIKQVIFSSQTIGAWHRSLSVGNLWINLMILSVMMRNICRQKCKKIISSVMMRVTCRKRNDNLFQLLFSGISFIVIKIKLSWSLNIF